jgi:hypothetical protein
MQPQPLCATDWRLQGASASVSVAPAVRLSLIDGPRWLFLATLVSAPLLYGSTRTWAVNVLLIQIYAVVLLWIAGCCLERRRPLVHRGLLYASAFIVLQAWWMTSNAKFACDVDTFEFQPLTVLLAWAPGSLDQIGSSEASLLITTLCGTAAFVCDLSRHGRWRRRMLYAMVASGAVVAALGLLQRATSALGIFWQDENLEPTFFATFRNYDNAAAFLNLIWPLLAILLVVGLRDGARMQLRAGIAAALALTVSAIFVTRSRAASGIAVLLAGAILIWLVRQVLHREIKTLSRMELSVGVGLFVVLIGGLAVATGLEATLKRWSRLQSDFTDLNYRWIAYQVCLSISAKAGLFGFGPGTFQCVFPYFTHDVGDAIQGRWTYAHQDYLQAIIEWGYLGATAWAVFVGGAILVAAKRFVKHRRSLSFRRKGQFLAVTLALTGVLLHALVDFPLQIASIQLYVTVLIGMLWGAPHWVRIHSSGQGERAIL